MSRHAARDLDSHGWVRFADHNSWHPATSIFPLMTEPELKALAEDIRRHGLLNPVVVHQGLLLDGRNRVLACRMAVVEPRLVQWEPLDGVSPTEWVIAQNLKRRHLDKSQAAACAVEAEKLLAEEAGKRQEQAGAHGVKGRSHGVKGGRGRKKPPGGNIASRGFRHPQSRDRAAELFSVAPRYVQDAKLLAESAPEAFAAVKAGTLRIPVAKEIAKLSSGARREALAAALKAGKSKALKAVRAIAQRERAGSLAGIPVSASPAAVEVSPGDWWRLGRHLLYCGDTSGDEFRSALPKAALAFADPPYGAGVDEWDMEFFWKHDYLADAADVVAVTPGIASIFRFARLTAMPYRWSLATWVANSRARGAVGFGNWIYTAVFSRGSVHRNAQDFSRTSIPLSDLGATGHEGRKPTEYVAWILETFTRPGDTVIDPFGGSGTTLLVAERLGRTCVMGEVNPAFCAEIIARWGKDAKRQATKARTHG